MARTAKLQAPATPQKKTKDRLRVAVDLKMEQIEKIYEKLSRRMAETKRNTTITDYLRELIDADLAKSS